MAAVRGASGVRGGLTHLLDDTSTCFSCEEVGHNGLNEVDVAGNNFWIDEVEGGSNQTYLILNVSGNTAQLLEH